MPACAPQPLKPIRRSVPPHRFFGGQSCNFKDMHLGQNAGLASWVHVLRASVDRTRTLPRHARARARRRRTATAAAPARGGGYCTLLTYYSVLQAHYLGCRRRSLLRPSVPRVNAAVAPQAEKRRTPMLVLSVLIVLTPAAGLDGAQMVSVGQGACRQGGHGMLRIGCSQSHSEAQGLAACISNAACGAMDWDPAANQTCLWGSVTPAVHAVESACGQAPHPAGCRCYKKSPLPTPQPPAPKVPPANCTSDEGCQLNGVCKNPGIASGSCECSAGWKGTDCVRGTPTLRRYM